MVEGFSYFHRAFWVSKSAMCMWPYTVLVYRVQYRNAQQTLSDKIFESAGLGE